jgi:hypothetical protein
MRHIAAALWLTACWHYKPPLPAPRKKSALLHSITTLARRFRALRRKGEVTQLPPLPTLRVKVFRRQPRFKRLRDALPARTGNAEPS